MARLDDILPPGETVRWRSLSLDRAKLQRLLGWGMAYVVLSTALLLLKVVRAGMSEQVMYLALVLGGGGGLVLIAMFLLLPETTKAAVTEAHVVWSKGMLPFGREEGKVASRDIRAVDAEEGEDALTLYCGDARHRIETIRGGDVEGAARATDRPARIWWKCKSPAARRARRWRLYSGAVAAGLGAMLPFGFLYVLSGSDPSPGRLVMMATGAAGALSASLAGHVAKQTLPHLLVGRFLSGGERRDFVGVLTDLRWEGLNPNGPDYERKPPSRLGYWAMRKAYGEIPDIGERKPEILIRGEFPDG